MFRNFYATKNTRKGRTEKNVENMTMSLTAIEYQIYSYVKQYLHDNCILIVNL